MRNLHTFNGIIPLTSRRILPPAVKPVSLSLSFQRYNSSDSNNEDLAQQLKASSLVKNHLQLAKLKQSEAAQIEKKQIQEKTNRTFKQNIKTVGRILQLGKPDIKLFLLAMAFILCAVLYPTTAVKLVGSALDAYNLNTVDDEGYLLIWGYRYTTVFQFMVPFMCLSAVCFWARIWVLKILGERLVARLRFRVMKSLLRHDSKFYDNEKNKVGDLISRLSSDAYIVSRSITSNLPDGLKNLLFGVISAYMMYSINPILFGVMCLISPPITFGSVWYGEKIRKLSTRLQNATAGMTKISEETLNAIKLVKAFTGESKELDKYSAKIRQTVNVAKQEALAQSNYSVSIYSLYHTGYLSCVALGLYLIMNGQMTTGDVVAFTMYSEFFNASLYSLTTTYLELMKGAGAGVKLFELMDYKSEVPPVVGEKKPAHIRNDIEFKDVVFSYPTRSQDLIFNGCNFKIRAGTSTCIVAPSGCGKSTVAALLLRSYNLQSGQILIGGKDITELQVRDLRRDIIGIVQQEPLLLSGTILENIVYGLTSAEVKDMSMDEIIEVCKQAHCHEFIMSLPDGYDTVIGGSGGVALSGGQKQRVAIARALIKKPSVLILDEATSALDSKSESLINETLKELTSEGKMTIISIAHRLSTISKSEYVVVLGRRPGVSGSQVVEEGRFVELFANPNSELSKLLDESAHTEPADSIEEIEHINREAKEIEQEQKLSQLDHVRSLVDQLSPELREQLISEVNQEAPVEPTERVRDR
ncbi:uncharacterized protein SPAPADRAFT_143835 [Spathaspora passalidarum NRRL Y-27907]|uniref:Uncharacterized protein n=1 Tax=Spathaspora passalidarum (strain NRRL Y-27907 / 11-Y1) TaxID=619300 RepID=G3AUL3_SPAPN|nr:uncharacterized protein SPAPADRAFT_143835 [Spathaspora passalidarum NRRL Y-27907]EGW30569.1 hypothetical protein SPAPADRAFT_143835 [Spathaspora passalidarum NRRL Y-27907]